MKLLVINQPLNNRGDEAAHKAFIRALLSELPDAYLAVLFVQSYSPEGIRQFSIEHDRVVYFDLHPSGTFWRLAERWIDEGDVSGWASSPDMQTMHNFYEAADAVICAPGGICMGAFQDWWHLFYLKYAHFLGKPLVYYGRSFGPFSEETVRSVRFKAESIELLRYFSFISVRDKITENFANQVGGLRFFPTTDVAFLERPCVGLPQEVADLSGTNPYVVFVPNYLLWHPSYKGKVSKETVLDFYCAMIDIIREQYPDDNIVMLPQTFGAGTYEGDDVFFFREIEQLKNDRHIVVVPDVYSSDIQQTIIASSRLVIGARYHSVVFALNQNVPFVALNYEHKICGLLTALHKEDCMVDIMNAFESEQTKDRALKKVRDLLASVRKDDEAYWQASDEARRCILQLRDLLMSRKAAGKD